MTIRTTEDLAALIKQLRDGGATRIEVKPDGTVSADFGQPRVEHVPQPYPVYVPQWPRDILGPWWGINQPTDFQPFTNPTITWSTGNNTTITFTGDGDAS